MVDVQALVSLIMCHAIGDYVLQTDFLAKTKTENCYHLFIHCVLYCVPFAVVYGIDWRIAVLFVTHLTIDFHKCRGIFSYTTDQTLHYLIVIAAYWGS